VHQHRALGQPRPADRYGAQSGARRKRHTRRRCAHDPGLTEDPAAEPDERTLAAHDLSVVSALDGGPPSVVSALDGGPPSVVSALDGGPPGEAGAVTEGLLDAQQLVVLRYALGAGRRAGLDLTYTGSHHEVGDQRILGLA
jgi:hypothetical protein